MPVSSREGNELQSTVGFFFKSFFISVRPLETQLSGLTLPLFVHVPNQEQ
jgi:hypothetical protein